MEYNNVFVSFQRRSIPGFSSFPKRCIYLSGCHFVFLKSCFILVWASKTSKVVSERYKKRSKKYIHPGRLTWNIQITHLERNMIFQTSMIMFHGNLQGCTLRETNMTSHLKIDGKGRLSQLVSFWGPAFCQVRTCCEFQGG